MTEEAIKAREPELLKKGFMRIVPFNMLIFMFYTGVICMASAILFLLSFFSKDIKGGIIFLVAGVILVIILLGFWKNYYQPWRKFRRQIKKLFEAGNIVGFFVLCPLTYSFQTFTVFKEEFKSLKQLLNRLRQVKAVFIIPSWGISGEWRQTIQDEHDSLISALKEEDKRFVSVLKTVESMHKNKMAAISKEIEILDSLQLTGNYLKP
jgi:hypothetical protein